MPPLREADGRPIGHPAKARNDERVMGSMTERLIGLYQAMIKRETVNLAQSPLLSQASDCDWASASAVQTKAR